MAGSGVRTVASRVRERATETPDRVALWGRRYDTWQPVTWAEYWDCVATVANGLTALGIGPGDRVAIHAGNRPEWLFTDVGALAARAISVGIYPTSTPDEARYLVAHSAAKVLVVDGRAELEAALYHLPERPHLAWIIYLDPAAVQGREDHPKLLSWADLLQLGAQQAAAHPDALAARMAEASGDDVATVIYTSGTTGQPKGARLTVSNVDFLIETLLTGGGFTPPVPGPDDVLLSYLPLCNVAERISSTWLNAGSGIQVYFAQSPATAATDLAEVRPTILLGVPRLWEKLTAGLVHLVGRKGALGLAALAVAGKTGKVLARRGGRTSSATRTGVRLAERLGLGAAKAALGLDRVRYAASGAAPIAPELLTLLLGAGIAVHEVYGLTESGAIGTANLPGRIRVGTVGEAQKGVEVRLDGEEILIRHPGVFAGYLDDPVETERALTEDGWLRTGDAGRWDGNHLRLTGRIKDILVTAGGLNLAPAPIENALRAAPLVAEAIVVGDGRPYLTALIRVDGTAAADASELELRQQVQSIVDKVNADLARPARLKDFRLLPRDLDPGAGELTATLKIRRSAVMSAFADLVQQMYPPRGF